MAKQHKTTIDESGQKGLLRALVSLVNKHKEALDEATVQSLQALIAEQSAQAKSEVDQQTRNRTAPQITPLAWTVKFEKDDPVQVTRRPHESYEMTYCHIHTCNHISSDERKMPCPMPLLPWSLQCYSPKLMTMLKKQDFDE